jgi:hypothetical protein
MDPKEFWLYKIFEPGLTIANDTTCGGLGYPTYDSTVTHGFGPVSMTLDLYNPSKTVMAQEPLDTCTLYKITQGECGQATIDKKYESYAIKFAGLKEGTCSAQGYTEAAGGKSISVPVLGNITIELFKKTGAFESFAAMLLTPELEDPLDQVTLYKISSDTQCGQATIDKKYESYAVKFAGLKEGTCTAQGFTVAAGSKDITVPVLGHITVELFEKSNKASASGVLVI